MCEGVKTAAVHVLAMMDTSQISRDAPLPAVSAPAASLPEK